MTDIEKIIDIIKTVLDKISEDTDVVWASYDSAAELQADIDNDLEELIKGNLDKLDTFKYRFLPTAVFQEVALSNGWSDEFNKLADEYDKLYERIKNKKGLQATKSKIQAGFIDKIKNWFS